MALLKPARKVLSASIGVATMTFVACSTSVANVSAPCPEPCGNVDGGADASGAETGSGAPAVGDAGERG